MVDIITKYNSWSLKYLSMRMAGYYLFIQFNLFKNE